MTAFELVKLPPLMEQTTGRPEVTVGLIGGAVAKDHLPGKIWLCTPDDEKSYLLGSFNATISRPKPPKK